MNFSQIKTNQKLIEVEFNNTLCSPPDKLSSNGSLKSSILSGDFSLLFFEGTIASLDIFADNILDQITESTGKITDEMAIIFVKLQVEYHQQNFTGKQMFYWVNREAARLADWFVTKAMYWLNANALNLHFRLQQNLQDHLQVLESYGGEAKITSLIRLNERLQLFTDKWEHKLQSDRAATKFQQQFFSTLCEQLQYPTWQQDPEKLAVESLSKLAELYTSKFHSVKVNLVVHLLKKVKYNILLNLMK